MTALYTRNTPEASPSHVAHEERIRFLAEQCAELISYYEGLTATLRRQRDTAQVELQVAREHLALLQVTP